MPGPAAIRRRGRRWRSRPSGSPTSSPARSCGSSSTRTTDLEALFTPWRHAYISGSRDDEERGCFFCLAGREPDEPQRLVVALTSHHVVLLNRHPYSNGHLMVAPREHVAAPESAPAEARAEHWPVVLWCCRVLEQAYRPDGINMGMNLGRAAGAGVPDHYHFHVVPRWSGDTNFMSVVAGTRLVPEDLGDTRSRLRALFAEVPGP